MRPAEPAPAKAVAQKVRLRHLRFSTDKEKLRWERAIETVWKTPLGEMYAEYLFSPTEDHADLPLWARMLTDRIFRDPYFIDTRLAAIQVMNDDLYVREQMTLDVNDRITVLTGHFDQERVRMQRDGPRIFFANAGAAILLAIPAGSPAVRRAALVEGSAVMKRLMRQTPRYPAGYEFGQVFTKFGKGYSKWGVFNAALLIYSAINSVEWLVDSAIQTPGVGPRDHELLLGLDGLVTATDLSAEYLSRYLPPPPKPLTSTNR